MIPVAALTNADVALVCLLGLVLAALGVAWLNGESKRVLRDEEAFLIRHPDIAAYLTLNESDDGIEAVERRAS